MLDYFIQKNFEQMIGEYGLNDMCKGENKDLLLDNDSEKNVY